MTTAREAYEAWLGHRYDDRLDYDTWDTWQAAWQAASLLSATPAGFWVSDSPITFMPAAQPPQVEPAALQPQAAPVAWIRFCSDGTYEGPIMDRAMEDVRKRSGAWTPLYARPVEARLTDAKDLRNGLLMAMNHIDQGRPKQARILISGVYAALSSTSQQGDKA